MSGWSAVGLADRSAVENLIEQIESLRRENKELSAENQRLISAQINNNHARLCNVENENTQLLASKISEIRRDLSAQMEGLSRLVYQQLEVNNDSTRSSIQSTERKLRADISVVQDSISKYSDQRQKSEQEEKSQLSEIASQLTESQKRMDHHSDVLLETCAQIKGQICSDICETQKGQSEMKVAVIAAITENGRKTSSQIQDISNQLELSLNQIMASQHTLSDQSCQSIAKSNEDLISKVEQYCTLALEEVRQTAENYKQMGFNEQEHLDKIRTLSDDMLELGEHQKIVMEHLSQLCQHSDQFMEIQKSINDIWEIMKAVWVDSLLNDFERNIQLAFPDSNSEGGDNAPQSDVAVNVDIPEDDSEANEGLSKNESDSFTEEAEEELSVKKIQ